MWLLLGCRQDQLQICLGHLQQVFGAAALRQLNSCGKQQLLGHEVFNRTNGTCKADINYWCIGYHLGLQYFIHPPFFFFFLLSSVTTSPSIHFCHSVF